ALLHQRDSTAWFERTNQNKAILFPFYQHIQHPVHSVIEIDISRARFVTFDERARGGPRKSVRRFIVERRISFHLDDNPYTFSPNQLCPVQVLQIAVNIDFHLELDITIHLNLRCLWWWIMEPAKLRFWPKKRLRPYKVVFVF